MGSSPTRGSSFFLGKVTALGVLCCFALFVCLILLASFFLPSHLSFKNMYMYMYKAITLTYNVLYMTFCSLIQLIPVMNADTKSWHKWPKKYNSAYKSIRRMYMYMYIVYIIIYIYIYILTAPPSVFLVTIHYNMASAHTCTCVTLALRSL